MSIDHVFEPVRRDAANTKGVIKIHSPRFSDDGEPYNISYCKLKVLPQIEPSTPVAVSLFKLATLPTRLGFSAARITIKTARKLNQLG